VTRRPRKRVAVQQQKSSDIARGGPAADQVVRAAVEGIDQRLAHEARHRVRGQPGLDALGAEPDHHHRAVDPRARERSELPAEDRLVAAHGQKALGIFLGQRQQTLALTGTQHDRFMARASCAGYLPLPLLRVALAS
jgi:hypothetical protein